MVRLSQNSFFGGQLDFEMMGRQDYQRYAKGATKLVNFNIVKKGGLDKRRGFDRILRIDNSNNALLSGITHESKVRMIPFAHKKNHGFVLVIASTDNGTKCFVIATSPQSRFTVYAIDDMNGIYATDEIDELDYQQCGDVLFIAHNNHPPARIVHDLDSETGNHGFHYETIDLSSRKYGIPTIYSGTVTRIPVTGTGTDSASLFTEHYKATAVYDGVETYPCDDFSSVNSSPYGASSWAGTNYPMPWTESQKILLTIDVPHRTDRYGALIYPEEIRVYKKAFNYYGLIGTVKPSFSYAYQNITDTSRLPVYFQNTIDGNAETNSTYQSKDKLYTYNGVAPETSSNANYRGKYLKSFKVLENGTLGFSLPSTISASEMTIKLSFGALTWTRTSRAGTTSYFDATYNYLGNKASRIRIRTKTSSSASAEYEVFDIEAPTSNDSTSSVTNKSFSNITTVYNTFANGLNCTPTIEFKINTSITTGYIEIIPMNGDAYINNITVKTLSSVGSRVGFSDNYITPDTSITPLDDSESGDIMSSGNNYPSSVALSQQRLIWASTKNDPARIMASEVGEFYNYVPHEIMVPSDAIDFKLPITRFAKINHICEMRKLLMFNSACEWLVDSSSSVQGLTYETIQAYPQSYSGSSERLKPIICNNSLIFCERTGQAVRRFAYDISNDGFAGRDVSVLSSSIFENNNIVDWTYQQFPYSTLWCVLNDGRMASFEFMEEQDIMAWMTHEIGGGGKVKAISTSYAVSPAIDEIQDVNYYPYATHEEVFVIVVRGTQMWIERMRVASKPSIEGNPSTTDSIYHALCLDGMRRLEHHTSGDDVPTDETGAIWIPKDTTTGATITRNEAIQKIASGVEVYEGFPYDATYVSVYPNLSNNFIGAGQFDIKHVQSVGFRLKYSIGGQFKAYGSNVYDDIPYRYDSENDSSPSFSGGNVTMKNNDTHMVPLNGVNNRDGRVEVKASKPYPFTMLSYEIDFEIEETAK